MATGRINQIVLEPEVVGPTMTVTVTDTLFEKNPAPTIEIKTSDVALINVMGALELAGGREVPLECLTVVPPVPTLEKSKLVEMAWKVGETMEVAAGIAPGTIGNRSIGIVTNHVSAKVGLPEEGFFQYDLSIFTEDVSLNDEEKAEAAAVDGSRSQWKEIVKNLLPVIKEDYYQRVGTTIEIASDFSKCLYTTKPLFQETKVENKKRKTDQLKIKLDYINECGRGEDYFAFIKASAKIRTEGMDKYLNDLANNCGVLGKAEIADILNLERTLNVALKTTSTNNLTAVGRNSFFQTPLNSGYKIGGGLVNWTGFSLVYGLGWKNFVNVDLSNAAFILGRPVLEVLADYFASKRSKAKAHDIKTWSPTDLSKASDFLRHLKIQYETTPGTRLTRRAQGISMGSARENDFISEDKKTNVEEYFWEKYGKQMQNPNSPLIMTGKESRVPAEFCIVKSGQIFTKRLNEMQTAAMIKDTAKPPAERQKMIQQAIQSCNFSEDPVLKEFNFEIGKELHQMNARVIEPPQMVYREINGNSFRSVTPNIEGSWSPPPSTVFLNAAMNGDRIKWTVVNLAGNVIGLPKVKNFFKAFVTAAKKSGLNLGTVEEGMNGFKSINPRDRGVWQQFKKFAENYDFLFVILGANDNPTYAAVKSACEVANESGKGALLTQCIKARNVSSIRDSVITNVLIKLNAKLGGVNHLIQYPQNLSSIDIMQVCPVMIFGADVTHPAAGSKGLSLAAVTGSMDLSGTKYNMVCKAQTPLKKSSGAAEIIQNLDDIVLELLKRFVVHTGHKPRKLLFFRDGVGDGQFPAVLEHEMLAIRKACQVAYEHNIFERAYRDGETGTEYQPKITFIAVQKRHKTRFFCQTPEKDGVGRPKNAPPGTVVDKDIVNPLTIDYYVLSHTGIQGTSKPTRYQVLWDDSDFTADQLQALTYYLCYAYAHCNQAVSYPAPTYYAHLACTRAKVYTNALSPKQLGNVKWVNLHAMTRHEDIKKNFPMHFL